MMGETWLVMKVVERKHMNAQAARTLVLKLKMLFPLCRTAFSDPDVRKSSKAFCIFSNGLLLFIVFPICVSVSFEYLYLADITSQTVPMYSALIPLLTLR
eukprot:TRINITY_DN649_c0_g1_i8.p1 TRINITY_DN649_c0_g1~~TRINITY_DN649_c0_g1_i8.p1  ORF type:complete len:100 (+),score=19.54 TRINITY_DN649_c0_g1_i8:574-873(+)